jgi:flagellar motor switch protein FliN/FliY
MTNYQDCWVKVATDLFSQALVGEPTLEDSLPKPMSPSSFGYAVTLTGDEEGRFAVVLDGTVLDTPFLGEGADQKAGWAELLQESFQAAAGEIQAKHGKKVQVGNIEEIGAESKASRSLLIKSGDKVWPVILRDDVRVPKAAAAPAPKPAAAAPAPPPPPSHPAPPHSGTPLPAITPGIELLLDVELEAALRFGCREMPLGEILDLGPGDVVQLDRHVTDPVDLIVGDKIVARGDVVLVNGNFGLRVTEVAAPRKRLESIRCLF